MTIDFCKSLLMKGIRLLPTARAVKIVVGFDCTRQQVQILRICGANVETAVLQEFSYTNALFSKEFFQEIQALMGEYLNNISVDGQYACFVVLPNCVVTTDVVTLPNMTKSNAGRAVLAAVQNDYKNYRDLQVKTQIVGGTRQNTTYFLSAVKKEYLTELYRCLAINRLYVKECSYAANCMVDGLLSLKQNFRRSSIIFLDVRGEDTKMVICIKGKLVGFSEFALGVAHLDEVLKPNEVVECDELNRDRDSSRAAALYERFCELVKRALLYHSYFKKQVKALKIESIVVNIPERYSYMIEKMNADNPELPLEYLQNNGNAMSFENLELFGALFMGTFNKRQNF